MRIILKKGVERWKLYSKMFSKVIFSALCVFLSINYIYAVSSQKGYHIFNKIFNFWFFRVLFLMTLYSLCIKLVGNVKMKRILQLQILDILWSRIRFQILGSKHVCFCVLGLNWDLLVLIILVKGVNKVFW